MASIASRPWTVIVPVKSSTRAKSRIRLSAPVRRALAAAMARDTVSAVRSTGPVRRVVVVVEELEDGTPWAARPDVQIVVTSTRDLNDAILDALARSVDPAGPVAVVPADLPSLTAAELTDALGRAAAHPRSVVADRAGTGTTLLAAGAPALLRPRYGPGSFRRHVADGAVPLALPAVSGLRRDVDLVVDLPSATGPATRSVLAELARPPVRLTG